MLHGIVHRYRQSAWPPVAGPVIENAGNGVAAVRTMTGRGQLPFAELVPVTFDHALGAFWAPGAVGLGVVHIADIDIVQTGLHRDAAGALQGGQAG